MQGGGGAAEVNVGATKRMRRPSVRLHQPYYENPGHPKLQQQWRKGLQGPKKVHSKDKKTNGVAGCSKDEETEDLNFDDNVAIASWKKTFNAAERERDFKRKRVRPSSSKIKSHELEIFHLSSGGESGEKRQNQVEEEEERLGDNRIDGCLVIENSDQPSPSPSPNPSFGNDNGNKKLSDDNKNVGGIKQKGLSNGGHSNEIGGELRDGHGVRVWLNKLGLGKYAALFEVHAVDYDVLPLLTLEDLKDMGVDAVGSRRKMYGAIQKLSTGFP